MLKPHTSMPVPGYFIAIIPNLLVTFLIDLFLPQVGIAGPILDSAMVFDLRRGYTNLR